MFQFEKRRQNEELKGASITEYIAWHWKHNRITCIVVAIMVILFIACFVGNDVALM